MNVRSRCAVRRRLGTNWSMLEVEDNRMSRCPRAWRPHRDMTVFCCGTETVLQNRRRCQRPEGESKCLRADAKPPVRTPTKATWRWLKIKLKLKLECSARSESRTTPHKSPAAVPVEHCLTRASQFATTILDLHAPRPAAALSGRRSCCFGWPEIVVVSECANPSCEAKYGVGPGFERPDPVRDARLPLPTSQLSNDPDGWTHSTCRIPMVHDPARLRL